MGVFGLFDQDQNSLFALILVKILRKSFDQYVKMRKN